MFFAPMACAASVSRPLFNPMYGPKPHMLRTIVPMPMAANKIGWFYCPMKMRLIVDWARFRNALIHAGIANCRISEDKFILF